ncbi:MAG TPA: prephenate dehydrogenase/arogenate dehydrogenase family protein [Actinomycetota bacterium]|jgi:prephenate dehydrogenase|nr:prephenate dehydrogenase/arogenate dehydrogenase family protein [Actinomycetota bacterium]
MTSTLEWPRRLAIVGTGLLGASVGLAARAAGVAEVVGADNDRRELRDALEREAITSRARSVEEAAEGADLVVAATPVRSLAGVLARALAANPDAVITDVGSTKLHLLAELQRSSANASLRRVIPGHPMAGSEERGARAARVDLFHGAAWVLTPAPHVDHQALRRLTSFVRDLGGRPLMLDPELHDQVAAFASHLPQLAATALMGAVAQVESPAALRRLVASGFRDTTRVAASDPDLWVDICATNGPSIVAALDVLTSRLEVLRKLIAEGNRAGLREELAAARAARLRIPTKPGSSPRGLREVVVHIADRPGSLAAVFHALGAAGVNVEDLAIDHELQGGSGALRIWVAGRDAATAAIAALELAGWPAHEGTGAP